MDIQINADLVRKIEAGKADLANCNADKAALRAWSEDMAAKPDKPVKAKRRKRFGIL